MHRLAVVVEDSDNNLTFFLHHQLRFQTEKQIINLDLNISLIRDETPSSVSFPS